MRITGKKETKFASYQGAKDFAEFELAALRVVSVMSRPAAVSGIVWVVTTFEVVE